MRKFLFFIATALLLFLFYSSPGSAGEPLTPKWTREGLSYEGICKPGKLLIAGNGPAGVLVDLTNGEIIYQTNPEKETGLSVNYYGDKFYIYDEVEQRSKEFDVKTKEFIGYPGCVPRSPDNAIGYFNMNTNILKFYVCGNSSKNDSIKIPNTPDTKIFNNWSSDYSPDGRYFALTVLTNTTPQVPYFYLYDRTKREFLFEGKKDFKYCLFNKSNKIAYAENMKLAGDDTIYSYIRIYDPDQRKVVQDIKISKQKLNYFINRMDDNYIIYALDNDYNTKGIYDYYQNKIINNDLKIIGSPLRYADSTLIVTAGSGYFCGNIYDWIVGVEDKTPNEDLVLYPNPTNNRISVNISEKYYSGTWQILDMTSKIMMKGIILPQNLLQINLSKLQPQTYFLTIKKDNIAKTYKIVKL
jgi:hypothetical protein